MEMEQQFFRPSYHFTPERNWMNDPNGLVYYDGEYHLFYQHNPQGRRWGHMSWGHAVSRDLVRWEHLPIAIPEEPEAGYTIFSGSAVVDWQNRSGFGLGRPPMVAAYTAFYPERGPLQSVHIAYSNDRGRTFQKYDGNPVIDVEERKFGDPKVFWHEVSGRWVMANIRGHEQGTVDLYASDNLRQWEHLSTFEAAEAVQGVWECPDLFPLSVENRPGESKWLLKVNGPNVHSYVFVGEFDGTAFRSELPPGQAIEFDYGNTYAEVTYNGLERVDGRRILMGWVRMQADPRRDWTGMQSVARELTLSRVDVGGDGGWQVRQRPVRELKGYRRPPYHPEEPVEGREVGEERLRLAHTCSSALEVRVQLELGTATRAGLRFQLGATQAVRVTYDRDGGELLVTGAGRGRVSAPYAVGDVVTLHILLDRCVMEVFAGQGECVITELLEPVAVCQEVSAYADGGRAVLRTAELWRIAPHEVAEEQQDS
jgi:fructan beta-fructosidase